ncbi:unnamed protein product [Penicillium manginii]
MEWVGFIRRSAWKNAGFGSLGLIWEHFALTEPRYDPTVLPIEHGSDAANLNLDAEENLYLNEKGDEQLGASSTYQNSIALYRFLYLSGELTPVDVVRAILPLIRRDKSPPSEHSLAWLEVHADLVLEAAMASTLRYKEKRSLGLLDGIPTAVKDEYDMEGYKTTLGSRNDYANLHVPQVSSEDDAKKDSWCVRKMQEAGAIVLGKLSLHEFGMAGYNITYGTPRNPYNTSYYTGGSSSGSAYAVAAGLVPVSLGSDGGGSIRIPAGFCSVYGLKPTHGRLSFFPTQNHSNTAAVNGPMAADMRSLIALYDIISRPHPRSSFPQPLGPTFDNDGMRPKLLGISEAWFECATPVVRKICWNLIDRLVDQKGYTVVPIEIPFVQEGQTAHAITLLTDAATLLHDTNGLSPANRILLALGRTTPASDYQLAQKLRHVLMQHLAWLWQQHPGMIIVTPTTASAGWPIRDESELMYGICDGDQTIKSMVYVWLANFCGVPSISVPAGFAPPEDEVDGDKPAGADTPGKVPVGLMGTGEWCSEDALFRFGLDAEEVCLGRQSRPPNWVDVVSIAKGLKKTESASEETGCQTSGCAVMSDWDRDERSNAAHQTL